jgi:hypothetical protein
MASICAAWAASFFALMPTFANKAAPPADAVREFGQL